MGSLGRLRGVLEYIQEYNSLGSEEERTRHFKAHGVRPSELDRLPNLVYAPPDTMHMLYLNTLMTHCTTLGIDATRPDATEEQLSNPRSPATPAELEAGKQALATRDPVEIDKLKVNSIKGLCHLHRLRYAGNKAFLIQKLWVSSILKLHRVFPKT